MKVQGFVVSIGSNDPVVFSSFDGFYEYISGLGLHVCNFDVYLKGDYIYADCD